MYLDSYVKLSKLVEKYNNSSLLSWWYSFRLWLDYGSVAEAVNIFNREKDMRERLNNFASKEQKEEEVITTAPAVYKRTSSPAKISRRSKASCTPSRNPHKVEPTSPSRRPRYEEDDDDNGIGLTEAVILGSMLSDDSPSTSSHDTSFDGFGGGGDFAGGGAGGGWSEDSPSTPSSFADTSSGSSDLGSGASISSENYS